MRRYMRIMLVALLALAAPAVSTAQQRGLAAPLPLGRAPGDVVLQYRTQLSLSAQQVAQIEQIRARLATQNQPLVARLRAAGYPTTPEEMSAKTVGEMRALREKAAELRPTIREIATNGRAAAREIQNLLTLEQYTRLRDLSGSRARNADVRRDGVGARRARPADPRGPVDRAR